MHIKRDEREKEEREAKREGEGGMREGEERRRGKKRDERVKEERGEKWKWREG